jgi:hypothetical protein
MLAEALDDEYWTNQPTDVAPTRRPPARGRRPAVPRRFVDPSTLT